MYTPPHTTVSAWKHDFSDLPPGGNGISRKKKDPPPLTGFIPGYVFLPGVAFRVRCSVPKGFRADTEHLCRSTPSHFAPIRTPLTGVSQSIKLLIELVRGAPSVSGHLAQHERQVWVFLGRRTLPFGRGGRPASSGRAKHPHELSSFFSSSSFLSFLNCCS